jgi:hypothetical protein
MTTVVHIVQVWDRVSCLYTCLVLDKSVNVMLCAVFTGGHLKHIRYTHQRLLRVPTTHHLTTHKTCINYQADEDKEEEEETVFRHNLGQFATTTMEEE